jgi:hypothetical protein
VVSPVRLQRSRARGSRLTSPNGLPVACVTRGTRWGNPYRPIMWSASAQQCVDAYRRDLEAGRLIVTVEDVKRELRGKNLACWCKEGPCHADVLLEVANG